MSFRRTKRATEELRSWHAFVQANASLFQSSGLPISIYESRERFDDLLMHGYIDHHDDPTRFFIGQLADEQRAALIRVVADYLRAGFAGPDIIGGFMAGSTGDEILRHLNDNHG